MGISETRIPVYKKVEMAFIATSHGPAGLLLKSRLGRRWQYASTSNNKKNYFNVGNFFDLLRIRNEPVETRGSRVGTYLPRTPPIGSFSGIRFTRPKTKRPQQKKDIKPIPKSHLGAYVTSFRKFS